MGGGAAITWALPDVMLKQWRAVWTALGGLWVAISAGRRASAGYARPATDMNPSQVVHISQSEHLPHHLLPSPGRRSTARPGPTR